MNFVYFLSVTTLSYVGEVENGMRQGSDKTMGCIGIEQLLDFVTNRTEAAMAESIHTHLVSGCSRCQNNLAWVEKVVRLAATDDSVEPPQWVLNQALYLFEQMGPQRQPGFLERVMASLVFDTLAQPQMAGVRKAGLATRQCLYRVGDFDVDLSFEPGQAPDTVDITGQVLRAESASQEEMALQQVDHRQASLLQQTETIHTTSTDHLGEFIFEGVKPGVYDLKITLADRELWIPELEVKTAEL